MKEKITVPAMGESITEATVGEILKSSGSHVEMDDEVLELETDKVNQVLYAPDSGTVNWTVKTGDIVKIGDLLGHVDTEGKAKAPKKEEVEEKSPSTPPFLEEPESAPSPASVQKTSSGASPRLSTADYLAEVQSGGQEATPATPSFVSSPVSSTDERGETRKRMTSIRKVIAKRLVEAQQTTAMLTTFNEADMTAVMELRKKYKDDFTKQKGVKLGFMSFFVKACVEALKKVPELNSYIDGEEVVHRDYYDIGIAVGTERGLVVPVVRGCDQLSFSGVEQQIVDYATKARKGTISLDSLQGGGFTITNGGVYGSLVSTPILNIPQSGILGMHKIQKRAVVVDDQIVIRPMMYLALSYDHRVVDGKGAVTFLVHLKESLEDPARLLLEL